MTERKLSYAAYRNKVLGGWIGKGLGGTVGRFEGTKRITHFDIEDLLPDSMVANDDLDIQLVWLDVLADKGIYFTANDLMQAWIDEYDFNFGEYAIGRRNFRRGIKPPMSGIYANEYYKTGMGCPIRSEVWGMGCPGSPRIASGYAWKDGTLDHEGDSVWAEQFLAAMEAEAFFTSSIPELIEAGLQFVPQDSALYRCVQDAQAHFAAGYTWQESWKKLRDMHAHPDCTYSPFNLGITVMALLYGGGDIVKTLSIAVNSGWDVDCTCSSSASLIGILYGADGFDRRWINLLGDKVSTFARPEHDMSTLDLITDITCRFGVTLMREGLLEAELTDIPDGLENLPTNSPYGAASLEVEYQGVPAIGAYADKEVAVLVCNHSSHELDGYLTLRLPEVLTCEGKGEAERACRVPAGGQVRQIFRLSVSGDAAVLPDDNRMNVEFRAGDVVCEEQFGLCGAPSVLVDGPYFDSYEAWLDPGELPEYRLLTTDTESVIIPDKGEEWGNHRVDIDKLYMPEDSFGDSPQGTVASIFADTYRIGDVFGLQGPCCAYMTETVISPDERDAFLFIGSDNPFKLWLNRECIAGQKDSRFWFCNNEVVPVKLKKGGNTLVLKLARTGADNKLTIHFRHVTELGGYDSHPIMTDLATQIYR